MKCPLCKGRGTEELPDAYGHEVLCARCKGAGDVRGYEKVIDSDPTAPPIKVSFHRPFSPTYKLEHPWRYRALGALRWLRSPLLYQVNKVMNEACLKLDQLLEWAEHRVWPHWHIGGCLMDYESPISKIIEDQSIKDIQDIEDRAFLDQLGKVIQ